jgi:hypothetical protein
MIDANSPIVMVLNDVKYVLPMYMKAKNSAMYGKVDNSVVASALAAISSNLIARPARMSTMTKATSLISEAGDG